ncbi:MAG: hypothetical protein K5895_00250 [Lachnospiraceae bacterium]|nr:hypothetical protein [Lachnospiraceae bacterium]
MIGEKLQMDYIIYGCVVNDLKSKESKLKLKKIEEGSNINLIAYDTMLVSYGKMIEMLKNFRSMVKQDTEKLTTIKDNLVATDFEKKNYFNIEQWKNN